MLLKKPIGKSVNSEISHYWKHCEFAKNESGNLLMSWKIGFFTTHLGENAYPPTSLGDL